MLKAKPSLVKSKEKHLGSAIGVVAKWHGVREITFLCSKWCGSQPQSHIGYGAGQLVSLFQCGWESGSTDLQASTNAGMVPHISSTASWDVWVLHIFYNDVWSIKMCICFETSCILGCSSYTLCSIFIHMLCFLSLLILSSNCGSPHVQVVSIVATDSLSDWTGLKLFYVVIDLSCLVYCHFLLSKNRTWSWLCLKCIKTQSI